MDTVALRDGSPSSRVPNRGLGTGSAPAPSAPMAISSAPVMPKRRTVLALGWLRGGAVSSGPTPAAAPVSDAGSGGPSGAVSGVGSPGDSADRVVGPAGSVVSAGDGPASWGVLRSGAAMARKRMAVPGTRPDRVRAGGPGGSRATWRYAG